ncbi:MAG: hypothetical protein KGI70_02720 [Patescibacteria group bacterium]|nr:hypothetical protein [Patescibacteria group bacterium]
MRHLHAPQFGRSSRPAPAHGYSSFEGTRFVGYIEPLPKKHRERGFAFVTALSIKQTEGAPVALPERDIMVRMSENRQLGKGGTMRTKVWVAFRLRENTATKLGIEIYDAEIVDMQVFAAH